MMLKVKDKLLKIKVRGKITLTFVRLFDRINAVQIVCDYSSKWLRVAAKICYYSSS